ncbi:MAG: glycerophosphodiester phosphodiesterase [Phycisphaerae bacterium]|nr:glycerophosphodiester phosphodiesterase [Gemmatimonadaceae bacterium]
MKKLPGIVVVALLTLAGCAKHKATPIPSSEAPRPLVIAHRGASGHRPEHTLEAYALAIAMGADYIEPDLVSTKDGVLVTRHENEIGSTTDVALRFPARRSRKVVDGDTLNGWFVEDFSAAELRTLRANERLSGRSHAFDGQFAIPTFEEVLALADSAGRRRGRTVGVYPELKHPTYFKSIGLSLSDKLLGVLSAHGLNHRNASVFIQSFEAEPLKELRPRTQVKLIQLLSGPSAQSQSGTESTRAAAKRAMIARLGEIASYADGVGVNTRMIVGADSAATPNSLVQDAHAAGLLVHVWTLRSERNFLPARYRGDPLMEVREFKTLGVDGIFGDFPDVVVKGLGRTP